MPSPDQAHRSLHRREASARSSPPRSSTPPAFRVRSPAQPRGFPEGRHTSHGKKHGGLPVVVCNVHAGTKELQLTQWESSHVNIIKGEGYLDFITRCCFEEKDVVEIWAFKERHFQLFGVDMCRASPLYVVLAKKEQRPAASSMGMAKCTM
uniref:Uncharacterized protein n=1 Tax=Aegilops tauschii TaxID=37682 RepID=N1R327_AEGTA